MKRSYNHTFVAWLLLLRDDLRVPKAVARTPAVDVVRCLKDTQSPLPDLRATLSIVDDAAEQAATLARFCAGLALPALSKTMVWRERFELRRRAAQVTARPGACRIKSRVVFSALGRAVFKRAVNAFNKIVGQV